MSHVTEERPVAQKHHTCFHCSRSIVPGEKHRKITSFDDGIQSSRAHDTCDALLQTHMKEAQLSWQIDFPDGVPPLYEMLTEDGEFEANCNFYRGRFPHAITRMELTHQLEEIEFEKRMQEMAAAA
jgi:hypothetical protein